MATQRGGILIFLELGEMAVTMAAMVALTPFSRIASLSARSPPKCKWAFTQLISCSSTSSRARKLVLYSKPGCCLCDGLKEKLQVAFSLSGPHALHDVELQVNLLYFVIPMSLVSHGDSYVVLKFCCCEVCQVRDITSNPEWEKAYQYEIPVLAKVLADGTEEPLPRLSPRLGVELIQKKIAACLTE
ncbi:hypothetical protein K2173_023092 [Erythroxylum novogranatense]|uniref:Glutaredoxin-like protein n=1 Tax=Erythroxylum novogranatense TaxID=1862640 RepID=A0AAV8T9P4_9ROSI|nr:hypothetical protein K2173_023092 [Erythroxylum novogranatense]